MRKKYEELWYDIKDELMDISRWTPTVSISKLLEKMENYEKIAFNKKEDIEKIIDNQENLLSDILYLYGGIDNLTKEQYGEFKYLEGKIAAYKSVVQ